MAEPKHYPESEKLAAITPQSRIIREFLEWLSKTKGLTLWGDAEMSRRVYTIESLLSEFFDIDMKKVEVERRQMIADMRNKPQ